VEPKHGKKRQHWWTIKRALDAAPQFNYQTLEVLPRGRLDRDVKAIKITKNRKKAMKSGH
jgi:hypothetical protein